MLPTTAVSCKKSSAITEMGDRLATTDMDRKVGASLPSSVRGAQQPPHNVAWDEAYLRTK